MTRPVLHDYFRSSAAYRVRIALGLKGVDYESRTVSLADGAHVRAMAMTIACDIHPLNNLRVLQYLKRELGHSQDEVDDWYRHWIVTGLPALEQQAKPRSGAFLFGDAPTAADVCLVPQLYNARRFDVPLDDYPTLLRAEESANKLDAFAAAHPDKQEVPA